MFTLTTSLPDEGGCTSLLRKVRWKDYILCQHCNSNNVNKSLTLYLTNAFDMIPQSDSLTVPITASVSAGFIIGFFRT